VNHVASGRVGWHMRIELCICLEWCGRRDSHSCLRARSEFSGFRNSSRAIGSLIHHCGQAISEEQRDLRCCWIDHSEGTLFRELTIAVILSKAFHRVPTLGHDTGQPCPSTLKERGQIDSVSLSCSTRNVKDQSTSGPRCGI
jgi:hypothetical protein